eukprot:5065418-Karenia_brevis.AAC.1
MKEVHTTFWGKRACELKTQDGVALDRMGVKNERMQASIAEARTMQIEHMLNEAGWSSRDMTARQAFQAIKGVGEQAKFSPPTTCSEPAPQEIN